jgi:hypothetical protein
VRDAVLEQRERVVGRGKSCERVDDGVQFLRRTSEQCRQGEPHERQPQHLGQRISLSDGQFRGLLRAITQALADDLLLPRTLPRITIE